MRLLTLVSVTVLLAACSHDDPADRAAVSHALAGVPTGARAVCEPSASILLEAAAGDTLLRLNKVPLDSPTVALRLVQAFAQSPLPPERRVVQLRVDSSRASEIPELLALVRQAGGRPFAPDSACSLTQRLAAI